MRTVGLIEIKKKSPAKKKATGSNSERGGKNAKS